MVDVLFAIDAVVADHLEIPIWDVAYKQFDEIVGMEFLYNFNAILMPMVEEGNEFTIVFSYPGLCHNRFSSISEDVFDQLLVGCIPIGFGVNIEAILGIGVDLVFQRAKSLFAEVFFQK